MEISSVLGEPCSLRFTNNLNKYCFDEGDKTPRDAQGAWEVLAGQGGGQGVAPQRKCTEAP